MTKQSIIVRNGKLVNRGKIEELDLYIENGRIARIAPSIDTNADLELDASGKIVMPGIIDDQVHFREPGLTHKATIATESRAAVAGGTTSFMEMPNVKPPSVTQEALQAKYDVAAGVSPANYSFYMGATNDNLEEVLRTDPKQVCGVKIFMGSSTGNMLVDNQKALEGLFSKVSMLIATHCEDEQTVRNNMELFEKQYGSTLHARNHPEIRSVEACLLSSTRAVEMAKKYGTRLHILHISTADEIALFDNTIPLEQKKITAEVCVHHLYFNADDYEQKGNLIKCNPAIKSKSHQEALFPALLDNHFDVIATDHAPHTSEEKAQPFMQAPSGLPLVQHSLNVMLDFYHRGMITLERIVEKMCHAPAIAYQVKDRGYLDEGAWSDVVIVDPERKWTVSKDNVLYKCGWSPLEGKEFRGAVDTTIVSGQLAWHEGKIVEGTRGERLKFDRD